MRKGSLINILCIVMLLLMNIMQFTLPDVFDISSTQSLLITIFPLIYFILTMIPKFEKYEKGLDTLLFCFLNIISIFGMFYFNIYILAYYWLLSLIFIFVIFSNNTKEQIIFLRIISIVLYVILTIVLIYNYVNSHYILNRYSFLSSLITIINSIYSLLMILHFTKIKKCL